MVAEVAKVLRAKGRKVTLFDYLGHNYAQIGDGIWTNDFVATVSDQQFACIDAEGPIRGAALLDWTIRPAAQAIANQLVADNAIVTVPMECPSFAPCDTLDTYEVATDQQHAELHKHLLGEAVRVNDPVSGISLRGVRAYDIYSESWVTRFDVLSARLGPPPAIGRMVVCD